jgi:hypothetical protein
MAFSWSDMFNLLQNISPVVSGAADQRAQGKALEANLAQQQNNNATSRYQAMVNANRLQNIEQPSANMSQAGKGALMSTWQPMSITPASVPYGQNTNGALLPKITGGPSMTPEMRQTGDSAMKAALQRQLAGNPINTSMFPSDSELGLNGLPKESTLDKILGYGSTATSILGLLGKAGVFGGTGAGAGTGITVGGGAGGTPMLGPGGVATPTVSATDVPWWQKIPLGGGGPGGGTSERTPYADMLMKNQLNEFGMGPDSSRESSIPEPVNRQRRWMTRR